MTYCLHNQSNRRPHWSPHVHSGFVAEKEGGNLAIHFALKACFANYWAEIMSFPPRDSLLSIRSPFPRSSGRDCASSIKAASVPSVQTIQPHTQPSRSSTTAQMAESQSDRQCNGTTKEALLWWAEVGQPHCHVSGQSLTRTTCSWLSIALCCCIFEE